MAEAPKTRKTKKYNRAGKDRPFTRVERLIRESGYTIISLSEKTGIAESTLRALISPDYNTGDWKVSNALKISRALGVELSDLIDEDGAYELDNTESDIKDRLRLVTRFNALNDDARKMVLAIEESFADDPRRQKRKN